MALPRVSRMQAAFGGVVLLAIIWLAVMVARPHSGAQTHVLGQFEKPATTSVTLVGPGPFDRTVTVAGYTVGVRITSNLATRPQVVHLTLSRGSQPVQGARVTLSYSMPSMHMPSVLTRTLTPANGGAYRSTPAPALEMPGDWLLSFRIQPMHGRSLAVALTDRLAH